MTDINYLGLIYISGGLSLLVLMSIGFVLTYMMEGFPNFAHTSHAAIGAIISFILTRFFLFNPYHTFPLSAVIGGIMGVILYLSIVKPIRRQGKDQEIRLTFVFLIIAWMFPSLVAIFNYWTRYYANVPAWGFALNWYDYEIYGVSGISWFSTLTCLASIIGFPYFLSKTKLGLSLRATAENEELAAVLGINTNRAHITSWFIAGALTALVGSMYTVHGYVDVSGLDGMIIQVMSGVVLGGLNIYGAIIGPILVYISQIVIKNLLYQIFGLTFDMWEPLIPIVFLLIVLNIFPEGVMGRRRKRQA
ncbi:MAG TPA: branched-chain amino acid ABC transporter permease [Candidatus Bathyarchaeia archaeon]